MKRLALILLPFCLAIPLARCAADPVNDLFTQAGAANNQHRYDDALALYERIIVEHPEAAPDGWISAQRNIAETLARKGDLAEAAKAVHLSLDAARNPQEFNDLVGFAANILSALDKTVDRANQLFAFQQSGPVGGAVNPMDAVGYPSLPDRERAFAALRDQAGDTPEASRIRAFTFLLTGKPKDALAQFADGFRRSTSVWDLPRAAQELSTIGLRAVRGHQVGIDKALQFVMYGPNGPDGKPQTADDLADPFAEWLPAPPAPGEGGLAGLSADDLAALRKVRDACQLYAGDKGVNGNLRGHAFAALHRVNIALDNWGVAGQTDWYLRCAFEWGDISDILPCMLAAARGRALNFGGDYALLAEIDTRVASLDTKPKNGIEKSRAQFEQIITSLQRITFPKPTWNPLKQPASF